MKDKTKYLLQDLEYQIFQGASKEYKVEMAREESARKESFEAQWPKRREAILIMNEVLNEK